MVLEKGKKMYVFLAIFAETYLKKNTKKIYIYMCCSPLKSGTLYSFCYTQYTYQILNTLSFYAMVMMNLELQLTYLKKNIKT